MRLWIQGLATISFLFGVLSIPCFALTPHRAKQSKCAESLPHTKNLVGQVIETSKGCSVMVSPDDNSVRQFRRYSFSERGIVQIFNQYGEHSNGSRSYFLFPRRRVPSIAVVESGDAFEVVTSTGDRLQIDATLNPPKIRYNPDANLSFIESSTVSLSNGGGVELKLSPESKTIILDAGFQMGGAAFTHPTRTSIIRDAEGNECPLLNSKLFTFANYDADLKFKTDAEFYAFLREACPKIHVQNK